MTDVLFVMGMGRSGSTALERYLAAHSGTAAVGEIGRPAIWRNGFEEDTLCACRAPMKTCPFWQDVRARAFGHGGRAGEQATFALTESVNRIRHLPMIRHRRLRSARFKAGMPGALGLLGKVYDAVAAAAGGRLIVDSTKNPSYAHLLSLVPGLRVAFVHLVRDSRAVAFSYQRVRIRPEFQSERRTMSRMPPRRTARVWNVRFAASLALVAYARRRVLQVRYEDFAADPARTTERIGKHLRELGMQPLGELHPNADPECYHSIESNPVRFEGEFAIRPDLEWRTAMPSRQKLLVGALTLPFLILHRLRVGFRRYETRGHVRASASS